MHPSGGVEPTNTTAALQGHVGRVPGAGDGVVGEIGDGATIWGGGGGYLRPFAVPGRLADVQSMLAYIYWQQGAAERALAQVEEILAYRAGVALLKSDDPVYLEWCCYQVLQGVGDARAAVIWAETHQKLLQQMAQLESNFLPQRMAQVPTTNLFGHG
ncbi:MAG: hypothetical protein IPL28_02850 [Chloroflexi bacterium]|nr:hypothetical protein [Chloroflexota bacterium]